MDLLEQNNWCFLHHYTRRQCHYCTQQIQTDLEEELQEEETRNCSNSTRVVMASSCSKISPIISIFVFFLFFIFSVCPVLSLEIENFNLANQTFKPGDELQKMKMIKSHLMKINKPSLKTIQSPDGDIIDCVLSHQQPAFDHPHLKGQKPLEPPERPKGHNSNSMEFENFQLWRLSGETCPEGTIPVRRTKEQDILRASSIRRFGRKIRRPIRRDTTNNGHEHAVGYVTGEQYYGAKASINVCPHPPSSSPDLDQNLTSFNDFFELQQPKQPLLSSSIFTTQNPSPLRPATDHPSRRTTHLPSPIVAYTSSRLQQPAGNAHTHARTVREEVQNRQKSKRKALT